MRKHSANIEDIEPPGLEAGFHSMALSFREQFYPDATCAEWNDWRWQLRNRISDLHELERIILLSEDERNAIVRHGTLFSIALLRLTMQACLTKMTPHNPCAEQ